MERDEVLRGGWAHHWRDGVARAPWAPDILICTAAVAGNVYRIGTGTVGADGRDADGWAFALGVAMALCLLGRRRWPAAVLAVVSLLWFVYHVLDYPGGAPAVAVWVALYSVAAAPRRRTGLVLSAVLVAADALGRAQHTQARFFDSVLDGSTVVFVAMLLLGDAVRSRRARRAEFEARIAALAERREHETAQRVAEERIRIARELHDVSAHTIAVIGVQSSVAAELLDDDPPRAREALQAVRRATSEALGELRATVRVLREEGSTEETAPAPGLDDLERLVRTYGDAGPRIAVRTEGGVRPVPRLVGLTAYRIVQEALANALRHGDPGTVEVVVRYRDGGLDLEVRDDGHGARGGASDGHGLRGMAERAAMLGGRVEAGTPPGGGFRVNAWLPCGGTT